MYRETDAQPKIDPLGDFSSRTQSHPKFLLIHGALDPRDRPEYGADTAARWAIPASHHVVFPFAGHATVRYTQTDDGDNCTRRLWVSFLRDPESTPDTSCVARVVRTDFTDEALADAAETWFGMSTAWPAPEEQP